LVAALLSGVANLAKRFVMPAIKKQLKRLLEDVVSKLPKQISIPINGINYKLDVTLSESGIQLRNKFLEINSNARLFNENKSLTKTKSFPQVTFPSIKTMGSQLQLYISEYSINSALYTYFRTDPLSLTLDSKIFTPLILGGVLPQLYQSYGNDQLYVVFNTRKESDLSLDNNGITGYIYGNITIKVKGTNEVVFQCDIDLIT
jgi:histone deacetylase complex regulatory component SIN3